MRLLRQLGIVVTLSPPLRGLLQFLANVQLIYLRGTGKCLAIFLKISKRRGIGSTYSDYDGSKGAEINQLRKELNNLLANEKVLWHQRSKVH